MVVAQWQSTRMWPWRLRVRIPSTTLLHLDKSRFRRASPKSFKNTLKNLRLREEALRSLGEEWAKMWFVYLLRLKNNSLYSGLTNDLKRRIQDHNLGECIATKDIKPAKLIWYSEFHSKELAVKFERYLKTASGIAFRNKRLI